MRIIAAIIIVLESCPPVEYFGPFLELILNRYELEICYNIRYPERNGREKPAWSMRHTALPQVYDHESGLSRWVLVQPARRAKDRVRKLLQEGDVASNNPAILHLITFLATECDWREYLNELYEELIELVSLLSIQPNNLQYYYY